MQRLVYQDFDWRMEFCKSAIINISSCNFIWNFIWNFLIDVCENDFANNIVFSDKASFELWKC